MEQRKHYEAPQLIELGTVEALTLGGKNGAFLDNTFPTGTPFSQLTFS